MSNRDRYLVEITAYKPGTGVVHRYYANEVGFITSPSDTPANTVYHPRILQPANIIRSMFANVGSTTGGRVGFGTLVLDNTDYDLTELLGFGLDGRDIVIKWSDKRDPAYSDFTTMISATMEQPYEQGDTICIKLRDNKFQLDVPLQSTKYAGSGGLEGGDDLKGKPKPLCFGVVKNISPPLVDPAKLIYQVSDSEVHAIDNVYDRGLELLSAFTWATGLIDFATPFTVIDFAYGNSTYVVVGHTFSGGVYNYYIYTSPDLATWTSQSTAGFTAASVTSQIGGLRFANSIFMLTLRNGDLATSADGATWTQRTTGLGTGNIPLTRPAFGNDLWVVVKSGTTSAAVSADNGVTWTTNTGVPSLGTTYLTFGNGAFLVAGQSGWGMAANGANWASGSYSIGTGTTVNAVEYGEDLALFVIVGSTGLVMTSDSGQAWVRREAGYPLSGAGHALSTVAIGGGIILVGGAGGLYPSYSADGGATWHLQGDLSGTLGSSPAIETPTAANYANGKFLVGMNSANFNYTTADSYADTTDLLDDDLAPPPGTFKVLLDASGSYFRLGADPDGLITSDVTEGATAADRTAAQIANRLLDIIGESFDAADVTAMDTDYDGESGIYAETEMKLSQTMDLAVGTPAASWFADWSGAFRLKPFEGPAASTVVDLTARDLLKPPARLASNDVGRGLPIWKSTVRYAKNYTVQTQDLAAAVSTTRRAFLAKEWREESDDDSTVQTVHLLAPELIEETQLANSADAASEATRRLALRGRNRDRLQLVVPLNTDTLAVELADTIGLTHDRVGGTHRYQVIGIETDAKNKWIILTVFGPE